MAFQAFDSNARTGYWKQFHLGLRSRPMKPYNRNLLQEVQRLQFPINVLGYCSRWSGSWCSGGCAEFWDVLQCIWKSASRMPMLRKWQSEHHVDTWLAHCSLKGREGSNNIRCAFGIQCAERVFLLAPSPKPESPALESQEAPGDGWACSSEMLWLAGSPFTRDPPENACLNLFSQLRHFTSSVKIFHRLNE